VAKYAKAGFWHLNQIAHFRWGKRVKIYLGWSEKLSNVTTMKCLILSPISNQTPFALAKGVKVVFWRLKTMIA
jgi:hypothetical protein